jgi:hypothetical protein
MLVMDDTAVWHTWSHNPVMQALARAECNDLIWIQRVDETEDAFMARVFADAQPTPSAPLTFRWTN